jgi:uncharacterized Zn finger protein
VRPDVDHSQLVEISLYERNVEAAWRDAQQGGCYDGLWLQLAAARQEDHREDAVSIYLKQAEASVVETRNARYDDAVDLLAKAAALMKRLRCSPEFVSHLESLRVKYRIKRNFIKLFDRKWQRLYW